MTKATLHYYEAKLKGRLLESLSSEASTTTLTCEFWDEDSPSTARTPDSGTLMFVIDHENTLGLGTEFIKCASHATTGGVTTLTTVTRGLARAGYSLTGSATRAIRFPANTPIAVVTNHYHVNTINKVLDGTLSSGGDSRVGDETGADQTVYFMDDQVLPSFLRKDNANGKMIISHDGINTIVLEGAGGVFTASTPLDIASSDISLTLTPNGGLENSSGLKVKAKTAGGINLGADGVYVNGLLANLISDITVSASDLNGITDLTDGTNADTLHQHTGLLIAKGAITHTGNADGAHQTVDTTITIPTGKVAGKIELNISMKVYGYDSVEKSDYHLATIHFNGTTQVSYSGTARVESDYKCIGGVTSIERYWTPQTVSTIDRKPKFFINSITAGGGGNGVIIRTYFLATGAVSTNESIANITYKIFSA